MKHETSGKDRMDKKKGPKAEPSKKAPLPGDKDRDAQYGDKSSS